jgi:hypothetical protein
MEMCESQKLLKANSVPGLAAALGLYQQLYWRLL